MRHLSRLFMKKPDQEKLDKIVQILKENPQGIWIREIARKAELDKSLVSRYIKTHLKDQVETPISVPIKLVKLK